MGRVAHMGRVARVGRGDTRGQGGTVSAATRRQQAAAAGVIGDTPVSPVPPQGSRPRGAHGGARPPPAPSPLAHPCPPVPPRPDGHTRVLELQKRPPATSLPPREGQERWHRGHEDGCRRMGSTLGILGCWRGAHRRETTGTIPGHPGATASSQLLSPMSLSPPHGGGCREPWCWQVQHLVEAPPLPARRRHLERPLMSVECPSEQIAIEPSPAPAACLKAAIFSSRVHKRWN